jgi:hypothetical protein
MDRRLIGSTVALILGFLMADVTAASPDRNGVPQPINGGATVVSAIKLTTDQRQDPPQPEFPRILTATFEPGQNSDKVYILSRAVIEALSFAEDARSRLTVISPSNQDVMSQTLETMTNARIAINYLRQAQAQFKRFQGHDTDLVDKAAQAFLRGYGTIADGLTRTLGVYDKLNSVSDSSQLGPLLTEASQSAAEIELAWKVIPLATVLLTHALVDQNRLVDNRLAYLTISTAQRAALVTTIDRFFGAAAKGEPKGGQHAVQFSSIVLRQFLVGQAKSADAP